MDSCILCFTHSNKKYKVGIFSEHVSLLGFTHSNLGFARSMRSLASHRKSFFFQPLSLLKETRKGYKDNGFARSMRTRDTGLLKKYRDFFKSIENLFSFSHYPLLVEGYQTSREVCEQEGASLSFSLAGRGIKGC